jgi:hypothetical protein
MKTTTTNNDPFRTVYHRDHSVTIWGVYSQQWIRTSRPSNAVLATLSTAERARVLRHCQQDR